MHEALQNSCRNWHLVKGWDGDVSGCSVERESWRAFKSFIRIRCPQGKKMFHRVHIINSLTTKGLNGQPNLQFPQAFTSLEMILFYMYGLKLNFMHYLLSRRKWKLILWWNFQIMHLHPSVLIMLCTWTQIIIFIQVFYSLQRWTRRMSS